MRWILPVLLPLMLTLLLPSAAIAQHRGVPETATSGDWPRFPVSPSDFENMNGMDQWLSPAVEFGPGERASLALVRFSVFDQQSRIVAISDHGESELPLPQVALFAGNVVGRPDSSAFLSVSPFGVYGTVEIGSDRFLISSGPSNSGFATLIFDPADVPAEMLQMTEFACGVDTSAFVPRAAQAPREGTAGGWPCRYARIAVETDYEYLANPFGGNQSAATAYVATLFGAVSQIYARDVNTRIYVSYLRLWTTSNDPWTGGDTPAQLDQFRIYWNDNMEGEFRHLTHFLSARGLGGGVAYLDALCNFSIRYGLSANLAGYFPYPIQNNNSQNWDLMVVSHEIGHNFGAPHTHDMGIDYCAYGDCSVTPNGTIMSYCHLCSGGMSNVRMEFHPRTINEAIMPFVENEAPCNLEVVPPIFITQPAGANPACGQTLALHSEAVTLGPIVYRWRRNGVDLVNGGRIGGATTTNLTITNLNAADSGNYTLVATSICDQTTSSQAAVVSVQCYTRGDCNCDGAVDNFDVDAFVLALVNPLGYVLDYPGCSTLSADVNNDGSVTNLDIDPFISCLISGGCP